MQDYGTRLATEFEEKMRLMQQELFELRSKCEVRGKFGVSLFGIWTKGGEGSFNIMLGEGRDFYVFGKLYLGGSE